jgi:hypothetical protein
MPVKAEGHGGASLSYYELSVRAELLEQGGPALWHAFMDELRYLHLGAPRPERSVFGELQAAYESALAARKKRNLERCLN